MAMRYEIIEKWRNRDEELWGDTLNSFVDDYVDVIRYGHHDEMSIMLNVVRRLVGNDMMQEFFENFAKKYAALLLQSATVRQLMPE